MARFIIFLIVFLCFFGIVVSIVSMMFRRVGQWNYVVKAIVERYGGNFRPGGVLSNPSMSFRYNEHFCTLRYPKRRFSYGRQQVTEFSTHWPQRQLTFLLASKDVPLNSKQSRRLTEFTCDTQDFNERFSLYTSDLGVGKKLLSEGVRWHAELLAKQEPAGSLRVSIAGGSLTISKLAIVRRSTELDDFVRYCVEFLDQLTLTCSEGIDFEESDAAQLIEEVLCPICSEEIVEQMVVCLRCKTPHCRDCWEYNGQCATFACGETRFLNASATVQNNPVQKN